MLASKRIHHVAKKGIRLCELNKSGNIFSCPGLKKAIIRSKYILFLWKKYFAQLCEPWNKYLWVDDMSLEVIFSNRQDSPKTQAIQGEKEGNDSESSMKTLYMWKREKLDYIFEKKAFGFNNALLLSHLNFPLMFRWNVLNSRSNHNMLFFG